jgi:hypothetical protein
MDGQFNQNIREESRGRAAAALSPARPADKLHKATRIIVQGLQKRPAQFRASGSPNLLDDIGFLPTGASPRHAAVRRDPTGPEFA